MNFNFKQAITYFYNKNQSFGSILAVLIYSLFVGIFLKAAQAELIPALVVVLSFGWSIFFTIVNQRIHKPDLKYITIDIRKIICDAFIGAIFCALIILLGLIAFGPMIELVAMITGGGVSGALGALVYAVVIFIYIAIMLMNFLYLIGAIYSIDLNFNSLFDYNRLKYVFSKKYYIIKFHFIISAWLILLGMAMLPTFFTIIIPFIIMMFGLPFFADICAQFIRQVFNIEK